MDTSRTRDRCIYNLDLVHIRGRAASEIDVLSRVSCTADQQKIMFCVRIFSLHFVPCKLHMHGKKLCITMRKCEKDMSCQTRIQMRAQNTQNCLIYTEKSYNLKNDSFQRFICCLLCCIYLIFEHKLAC